MRGGGGEGSLYFTSMIVTLWCRGIPKSSLACGSPCALTKTYPRQVPVDDVEVARPAAPESRDPVD